MKKNIDNTSDFSSVTIKEFMEWFVKEYDGHWLPSDFTGTIDRLEGYSLAMKDSEEYYMFASALSLLRDAQHLLSVIKHKTDWKYRE